MLVDDEIQTLDDERVSVFIYTFPLERASIFTRETLCLAGLPYERMHIIAILSFSSSLDRNVNVHPISFPPLVNPSYYHTYYKGIWKRKVLNNCKEYTFNVREKAEYLECEAIEASEASFSIYLIFRR